MFLSLLTAGTILYTPLIIDLVLHEVHSKCVHVHVVIIINRIVSVEADFCSSIRFSVVLLSSVFWVHCTFSQVRVQIIAFVFSLKG